MDGASIEHSDSDSGESWTLLENNSVYADEAPDFIEEQTKHGAQHHEKDEDTDGISIISDSDHETPSPPLPDHVVFEKCHPKENVPSENNIPDYIPVSPHLPNIDNNEQDSVASEDFLGDSHAKHKTYVHRRNKRLSTVLNIIVLGSVITAAGVAIGHMWGAKNDCTMQTTSSVNKILSNLYKLQEENAYLRSKLKEFTFLNNNQVQQQKIQSKHNKCRRVFEESLSNNDPRKLTKCVDENYKNVDNLMEHLVKPKFEKEFVADIDKLKTVYLQNKSWLDDEITRRMKIEEELLKKYNNEVNSAKEQKKDSIEQKHGVGMVFSNNKGSKEETIEKNFANVEIPTTSYLQRKITYADSLQTEHSSKSKHDEARHVKNEDNNWVNSKHNINNFDPTKKEFTTNVQSDQNQKPISGHDDHHFIIDFLESAQDKNNNNREQYALGDNWTEVKPKFRRNEERYGNDYDKSFLELKQRTHYKVQNTANEYHAEERPNFNKEEHYSNSESTKHSQDDKSKIKKEKRNVKESSQSWKNYSNENKLIENVVSEENLVKDDRYVVNKLKQEKKKNGYINSNKKQKSKKNKRDKWNTKGEFGERYDAVDTPDDFVLSNNYKNPINFDHVSFINNMDNIDKVSDSYNDKKHISEKFIGNMEKNENKRDGIDQANWFEKRAVLRTEARKKYYEQFTESSPNNSSWYFRRMRKREQCRAKGDNSTFRKVFKDKKNFKIKH